MKDNSLRFPSPLGDSRLFRSREKRIMQPSRALDRLILVGKHKIMVDCPGQVCLSKNRALVPKAAFVPQALNAIVPYLTREEVIRLADSCEGRNATRDFSSIPYFKRASGSPKL